MQIKKKEIRRYTTKFINQNFRIKVFGRDENGRKINTLLGVSGIIKMIGEDLFYKFIKRCDPNKSDRENLDDAFCKAYDLGANPNKQVRWRFI